MERDNTNSFPVHLGYPTPSMQIISFSTGETILVGSVDGRGQNDPYIIGGED